MAGCKGRRNILRHADLHDCAAKENTKTKATENKVNADQVQVGTTQRSLSLATVKRSHYPGAFGGCHHFSIQLPDNPPSQGDTALYRRAGLVFLRGRPGTRVERRSQVSNRDRCAASCRLPRPRVI